MKETKLIILRGQSGSGKSSVAKEIQSKQIAQKKMMAYIEQDYFRRIILKEKDVAGGFNVQLIKEAVIFLLEKGYDVIAEGIFVRGRYEEMFKELVKIHPSNNFFFYFDISLEETFRRHNTKLNKNEFGEKELRDWYKDKDFLCFVKEKIIPESYSFKDTVKYIQIVAALEI